MPTVPAALQSSPGEGFTQGQLDELQDAAVRAKKIHRAASVATFNYWTLGLFGAPALAMGLFSLPSLFIGAGLLLVAYNEHRGAKMLRKLDLRAPKMLGLNQLGLIAVLVAYGIWGVAQGLNAENHYAEQIASMPQLAPTLEPLGELYATLSIMVYGGVIAFAFIFQGFNSWYYFSRAKWMRRYLEQTPTWVVQTQRAAIG